MAAKRCTSKRTGKKVSCARQRAGKKAGMLHRRGHRGVAPTIKSVKWTKSKNYWDDKTYTVTIIGTTGHKPGVQTMHFRNVFRHDGWWQLSLPISSKGGPLKLARNKKDAEKFLLWYRGASKEDRKLWGAGYAGDPDNAWGWNYETGRPETGWDR